MKYLEQIISILVRAGFVKSIRGPQGGYRLMKAPKEYTVGMILRQVEGSLAPVACLEGETNVCERQSECVSLRIWKELGSTVAFITHNIEEAVYLAERILILSPKPCSAVIDQLRIYLSARLADTVNLHGVYMDVLGMGVLITGDSGVGKSELALELISRGHGLVADDVVEMARIAPTTIEGRCPGIDLCKIISQLLNEFLYQIHSLNYYY